MRAGRIVVTQYCDDIRREVGNKYSLMGCYGNELIAETLPAVLQKLCAQVRVITPIDQPFSKLVIHAFLNEDSIADIEIDTTKMSEMEKEASPDANWITVTAMLVLSPLAIEKPCTLKIEAETEGETLKGAAFRIRAREPEDAIA